MTRRHANVPSTPRPHDAADRPVVLPRRQRAGTAAASAIVSCVLLSAIALGMADSADAPVLSAGSVPAAVSAA
jgi:hypothetical protein